MRLIERFIQDCRDLWQLITRGQPKDDPLLPYRMMAELAKSPTIDLDAWEADMFARSGVWWFDPTRYDGTPFAWPKRVERTRVLISDGVYRYSSQSQSGVSGNAMKQQALMAQIQAQSQLQAYQAGLQSNPYMNQLAAQQANGWHSGFDLLNPQFIGNIKIG